MFVADSLVECTDTPFFRIFKGFSKNNIEEAQRRHNLRTYGRVLLFSDALMVFRIPPTDKNKPKDLPDLSYFIF